MKKSIPPPHIIDAIKNNKFIDPKDPWIRKFMIEESMKIWPSAEGKVKLGNEASMNLFKSCGFKEAYVIFKR